MRKFITLLLALLVCASFVAGCNKGGEGTSTENTAVTTESAAPTTESAAPTTETGTPTETAAPTATK